MEGFPDLHQKGDPPLGPKIWGRLAKIFEKWDLSGDCKVQGGGGEAASERPANRRQTLI